MVEYAVLLVSRSHDSELSRIRSCLSRIGVTTHRLDSDALGRVAIHAEPDAGTVTLDRTRFTPTVTWIRHFAMRGFAGTARGAHLMLYRDSWRALVQQLGIVSKTIIGGYDPGRLEQYAHATALGIRVPRTVVTTNPASVTSTFVSGMYVVKALDRHFVEPEPGRLAWFHPAVVDGRQLANVTTFGRSPVLVQEYIAHERELRVYLIGAQLHAFEVVKQLPHDPWLRPDTVRASVVAVPQRVAEAIRDLAKHWNLPYAAFDFLIAESEPVFLEVNTHGDWRWFERVAGTDRVTVAAARMVYELHRVHTPTPALDILRFLGATPHQPARATTTQQ